MFDEIKCPVAEQVREIALERSDYKKRAELYQDDNKRLNSQVHRLELLLGDYRVKVRKLREVIQNIRERKR